MVRANGCGCGLLVAAGVGLFLGGLFAYTSLVLAGSRFLPGDPARFDPLASFPAIAAEAGEGARLVRFEARFVGPDGTLDLAARYRPSPTVEYRFARPAPPPKNAPPLGAGRRLDDQWFVPIEVTVSRPWQWYTVSRSSGGFRTRYQYVNLGMSRRERDVQGGPPDPVAPMPVCSLAGFWKLARERGAPADAVATVRYDASGYRFTIGGTAVDLRFGTDCRLQDRRR